MSDATLTRLIRPTKAHNSLYLKQAEREKLSLAGGTASLLSGCESQAILVKKTTHTCATETEAPLPADGRAGACLKLATTGR